MSARFAKIDCRSFQIPHGHTFAVFTVLNMNVDTFEVKSLKVTATPAQAAGSDCPETLSVNAVARLLLLRYKALGPHRELARTGAELDTAAS